jgi:hypothetical protein
MKIAIDLGHGIGQDRGAVGRIPEEDIINVVGGLVISKLENLGHEVIPVRPTDIYTVNESLYARYHKSDINNCDWCISIHANCGGGVGTEIFTYGGKEITEARNILNNIVSLGFRNRGIKDGSGLCMVRRPQAKSMLIEICFCDTSDVDIYNSVGADKIANAIVNGLVGSNLQSTKYKVGWNEDNAGWFYSYDGNGWYSNCWKQIADSNDNSILNYYYFDNNGYILTSKWRLDNNKWYYLDQNGIMVQAKSPKVVKWKLIGGKYYCFATDGSLYQDCLTYDGYKVDSNGAWDSTIPKK